MNIRTCYLILFVLLFSVGFGFIGVGSAETISVSDKVSVSYTDPANPASVTFNWSILHVDNNNFNEIEYYNVTVPFSASYPSNYTTFTIQSGGSGSGTWAYNSVTNKIDYYFNSGATITGAYMILDFDDDAIVSQITSSNFQRSSSAVSPTEPVFVTDTIGSQNIIGNSATQYAIVSNTESVTYTVDYISNYFSLNTVKDGNINSRIFINDTNDNIYCQNSAFDKLDIGCYQEYGAGLYINLTIASGAFTEELINSTGSGASDLSGDAVEWQNTSYSAGDTATISYSVDDYDGTTYQYYVQVSDPNNDITEIPISDNLGTVEYTFNINAISGTYDVYLIPKAFGSYGPFQTIANDTTILQPTAVTGSSQVWFNTTGATQYKGSKYGFMWNITDFSGFWNDYYVYVYRPSESNTYIEQEVYEANSTTDRLFVFDTSGTWTAKIVKCPLGVCSVGSSVLAYVNLNVASPSEQGTFSVTTDKASYQTGDTITYTVVNPSLANAYMTVRSPDGLIASELGYNTLIPPENGTTIYRQIPNGYAKGDYTVNIAHTEIYYPVLAQTTFNITTASATSNTLSLIWGSQTYNSNDNGLLSYSGNFNTSTLTVYKTDTTGALVVSGTPDTIGVNETGSTIVYFDREGEWKAHIVDSGNSENNIWANISVYSVDMYDIDPDEFKSLEEYCLWDNKTYIRGQPYTIDYKLVLPTVSFDTWQIEIINPNNEIYFTQELNLTEWNISRVKTDSISGIIPTNAQLGVYQVRMMRVSDVTGIYSDEIASSYMTVTQSAAPYGVDVPTQDGDRDLAGTGFTATGYSWMDNLLYFISLSAFWGFILFIVVVMVVATNKQASPALGYIAFVVANIEAIIGLWAPFTMYILVLTWVFAGIYFVFGRKIISGL